MTTTPASSFDNPRAALESRLAPLATTLDATLPHTKLIYRISGGPPGKRLQATLEVNDRGEVKHELLDELQSGEREVVRAQIAPEEALGLLREVVRSKLLSETDTGGGFLPDSLVGSITIQSGDAEITYYFLAHDQQRRRQGLKLNPPIKRLRPRLEALRLHARGTSQRPFEPPT